MKSFLTLSLLLVSMSLFSRPAPLVSIPTHDNFFNKIKKYCGKAFEGKVTLDNHGPSDFSQSRLIMHVRKCDERQLQIPFHVGDDASRTWIITKTGSGLSLKHDHRHKDGSDDALTMYGGHTLDAGYDNVQSFPADQKINRVRVLKSIGSEYLILFFKARRFPIASSF